MGLLSIKTFDWSLEMRLTVQVKITLFQLQLPPWSGFSFCHFSHSIFKNYPFLPCTWAFSVHVSTSCGSHFVVVSGQGLRWPSKGWSSGSGRAGVFPGPSLPSIGLPSLASNGKPDGVGTREDDITSRSPLEGTPVLSQNCWKLLGIPKENWCHRFSLEVTPVLSRHHKKTPKFYHRISNDS